MTAREAITCLSHGRMVPVDVMRLVKKRDQKYGSQVRAAARSVGRERSVACASGQRQDAHSVRIVFFAGIADVVRLSHAWDARSAPGNAPARVAVEVRFAKPGWKVEIFVAAVARIRADTAVPVLRLAQAR